MTHGRHHKSDLKVVLEELEALVRQRQLPISFNRGLSTTEMEMLATRLQFAVPPDAVEMFRWKNGCGGPCNLIPEFQFMPFEDVVEWIHSESNLFPPHWFPIFTNGGGDFLYLNASSKLGNAVLLWEMSAQKEAVPAFDSVLTLFQTVREAYNQDLFQTRSVGSLLGTATEPDTVVNRLITEAKDPDTWFRLKMRFNPISYASTISDLELLRRDSRTISSLISKHFEELKVYGTLKTKISASELHEELQELDYLLNLTRRKLSAVKAAAPVQVRDLTKHGLEDLIRLRQALRRS